MLQEGAHAPDFTLESAQGKTISLSDMLQKEQHVLLIFMRHLG